MLGLRSGLSCKSGVESSSTWSWPFSLVLKVLLRFAVCTAADAGACSLDKRWQVGLGGAGHLQKGCDRQWGSSPENCEA